MTEKAHRPKFLVCWQERGRSLGSLGEALRDAGCEPIEIVSHQDDSVSFDPEHHHGLIVMGGGEKSADTEGEYVREKAWLRQALNQRIPVFGICLGAQLLAFVDGGCVYRQKRNERYAIGWKHTLVTEDGKGDRLTKYLLPHPEVFEWHSDICGQPAGAKVLARSFSEIYQREQLDVFRIGENAYGVQFHPENKKVILADWLSPKNERKYRKHKKDIRLAREKLDEYYERFASIARKMLDEWIQLALTES